MAITLPRMSFEYTGMTYDPTRKVNTDSTNCSKESSRWNRHKKQFVPVPYNMQFELESCVN